LNTRYTSPRLHPRSLATWAAGRWDSFLISSRAGLRLALLWQACEQYLFHAGLPHTSHGPDPAGRPVGPAPDRASE